jgi:DNA-nicking Smr family endonuclease
MPNDPSDDALHALTNPEIWEHVARDVAPLPHKTQRILPHATHIHLGEIKRAIRDKHELDMLASMLPQHSGGSKLSTPSHACLLDSRLKKRLAKGKEKIDASFDLHGLTLAAAHTKLQHFLTHAYQMRLRTLLIITGKGQDGEGILRKSLPLWLDHAASQHIVQNYDTASSAHGGHGAYYVRLRGHEQGGKPHEHF